jgi:hypothetical protein
MALAALVTQETVFVPFKNGTRRLVLVQKLFHYVHRLGKMSAQIRVRLFTRTNHVASEVTPAASLH